MANHQDYQNISREKIIELFSNYVSPHKAKFFKDMDMEIIFGKREGCFFYEHDSDTDILNLHCNGGVFNLGHRNPRIIKAVISAMQNCDIGNHHFISKARSLLAYELSKTLPESLHSTVFSVGGGEAIDLAIKLARGYTQRPEIISAKGGYHGHTGFALAAGEKKYQEPFGPMAPGFIQIPFNDIQALSETLSFQTAAVIFETIPATLGMPIPAPDFYKQVQSLCAKNGTLFILDEVQTGLGRTGKTWGFEYYHVEPDIVVTGKGLSGGIYPIAATIFHEKINRVFADDPFIHISTFGGSEIGCYAALEVLHIIQEPGFLENVNSLSAKISSLFERFQKQFPQLIFGTRQLGLMIGLAFHQDVAPFFSKVAYEHQILSIYASHDKRIAQILPPLIMTDAELHIMSQRFESALSQLQEMLE